MAAIDESLGALVGKACIASSDILINNNKAKTVERRGQTGSNLHSKYSTDDLSARSCLSEKKQARGLRWELLLRLQKRNVVDH
jgi:hypothetical protein